MKTKVLLKKLCLVVALVLAVVVWVAVYLLYLLYLPFGIVRAFIDIDGFKEFWECLDDCFHSMKIWFLKGWAK